MTREEINAPMLIHQLIEKTARSYANKVILRYRKNGAWQSWTFSAMVSQYKAEAQQLLELGLQPGDRVFMIAENVPETLMAFVAVLEAGCTAVLIDPSLPANTINQLMLSISPQCMAVTKKYLGLLTQLNGLNFPVVVMETRLRLLENYPLRAGHETESIQEISDPQIAVILFSSGTSDAFKAVKLSHAALIAAIEGSHAVLPLSLNDSALALLPIYHVYPLCAQAIACLCRGREIGFLDALDSATLFAGIREFRPTCFVLVPRFLELFLRNIEKQLAGIPAWALSILSATGFLQWKIRRLFGGRVKVFLSGGAPLDTSIILSFKKFGIPVLEGYGLTETCGLISSNSLSHNKMGTVGRPPPQISIRINRPDELGEGEICFKGDNLMTGYFGDQAATAAVIKDGWFYTGDIGSIDSEGYLTIRGRQKDVIVTSSGKKACAQFIESHYQQIDGVDELAIVGISLGQTQGEQIHAAVKLNQDFMTKWPISEIKLRITNEINQRSLGLASHLQIQHIHYIEQFPKTNTMKVKRNVLKKMIEDEIHRTDNIDEHEKGPQFLSDQQKQVATTIQKKIAELLNKDTTEISYIRPFFQLGIDSLVTMDLIQALSDQYHLALSIEDLTKYPTIFELSNYLAHAPQQKGPPPTPDNIAQKAMSMGPKKRLFWLKHIKSMMSFFWKLEFIGIENIPTAAPYILCANHESHFDPLWIICGLPPSLTMQMATMAKKEHWRNFFTRKIAEILGGVPVDRAGDVSNAFQASKKAIAQGKVLLIFPEGSRTTTGALNAFKPGIAKLALETGVSLVPIAIIGAFEIYPPQALLPKIFNFKTFSRYTIRIVFGQPIQPVGFYTKEQLTEALRDAIVHLINDAR